MPVRSSQEDFLLRELRKVAAMIARALGFRSGGKLPEARAEVENAYVALLGPESPLLRALDVESVVRLIGHSRKLAALARLTATDAALAGDAGMDGEKRRLLARATALAEAAVALDPTDDEAVAVAIGLRAQ